MGSTTSWRMISKRLADVMLDVLLGAGEEVVQAHHVIAAGHQEVDQVRPTKPAPPVTSTRLMPLTPGRGFALIRVLPSLSIVRGAVCHERARGCDADDDVADVIASTDGRHKITKRLRVGSDVAEDGR